MVIMAESRGVVVPQLAAWRKYRALTQQELAQRAGVSRPTVARGEAGDGIDAASVRKLAKALRISIAALYQAPPTSPGNEPPA